jgi:hypothetical protein
VPTDETRDPTDPPLVKPPPGEPTRTHAADPGTASHTPADTGGVPSSELSLAAAPLADRLAALAGTTAAPAADHDGREPPPTIPGYELGEELGRGGMGVVFAAYDTTLHRAVAVKVMRTRLAASPAARENFLREARAAAVRHDNIVTVYHAGEHGGNLFIAFERLDGLPLDRWLRALGRADPVQVARIGRELAAGLAAAHALGLIHRDIKPSNVWLEGRHRRVKILDFGLAALVPPATQLVGDGTLTGSPAYMSPEQAGGGPLDHRTDLFSLGVILYELATGRRPFAGPTVPVLLASIVACEPVAVKQAAPTVPSGLAEVIERLLRKSPGARYQSAEAVGERLRAVEIDLRTRSAVARTGLTRDGEHVVRTDVSEPGADGTLVARVLVESLPAAGRRPGAARPAKPRRRWVTVLVMLGTLLLGTVVLINGFVSIQKPPLPGPASGSMPIGPDQAGESIGRRVYVEFVVEEVDVENGRLILRAANGRDPTRWFVVEVPAEVLRNWLPPGARSPNDFLGMRVRARGTVERAPGGGFVIRISRESDLEIPPASFERGVPR